MVCMSFTAKKIELQLSFKPCSKLTAASLSLPTWRKPTSFELWQNAPPLRHCRNVYNATPYGTPMPFHAIVSWDIIPLSIVSAYGDMDGPVCFYSLYIWWQGSVFLHEMLKQSATQKAVRCRGNTAALVFTSGWRGLKNTLLQRTFRCSRTQMYPKMKDPKYAQSPNTLKSLYMVIQT